MNIQKNDNILSSGYLREYESNNSVLIPNDIQNVIGLYLKELLVHEIGRKTQCNVQIKIHDDDILTSLKQIERERDINKLYNDDNINTHLLDTINSDFIKDIHDKLIDLKCGAKHAIFLTKLGNVYSIGSNEGGQCGLNRNKIYVAEPTLVQFTDDEGNNGNIKIIQISCGKHHSLFIDDKQRLFVSGSNYCGQLGIDSNDIDDDDDDYDDDTDDDDTDDDSDDDESDSNVYNVYNPKINEYFTDLDIKINKIDCGDFHSVVIGSNGKCYTFGHNFCGNLGNSENTEYGQGITIPYKLDIDYKQIGNIMDVSCGDEHNLLLTDKNNIISFGNNIYNQCSVINKNTKINSPFLVSKTKEFQITSKYCFVQKILCLNDQSFVAVDRFKYIDN